MHSCDPLVFLPTSVKLPSVSPDIPNQLQCTIAIRVQPEQLSLQRSMRIAAASRAAASAIRPARLHVKAMAASSSPALPARALHYVFKIGDRKASDTFLQQNLLMKPLRHEEARRSTCMRQHTTCMGQSAYPPSMHGTQDGRSMLARMEQHASRRVHCK